MSSEMIFLFIKPHFRCYHFVLVILYIKRMEAIKFLYFELFLVKSNSLMSLFTSFILNYKIYESPEKSKNEKIFFGRNSFLPFPLGLTNKRFIYKSMLEL